VIPFPLDQNLSPFLPIFCAFPSLNALAGVRSVPTYTTGSTCHNRQNGFVLTARLVLP